MKTILLFLFGCANVSAQFDCQKVGYIPGSDGYCYKFVTTATTYLDAAMDCARTGSRLATIANANQSLVVASLAPATGWPYFIGYNTRGPLTKWTFDSPTATPDEDNYHPWTANIVHKDGSVTSFNKDGSWDKQYTESNFSYICQYMNNHVGPCASNTIAPFFYQPLKSTNRCYSIIDNGADNQAYFENKCRTFGGHLAKIQSQQENDFLLQKFCWECIGNGRFQAFIGLYVAQDGSYMWTDGTKLQKGDYTNFQNPADYGKCVVMNYPTGKWTYADCNVVFAFGFCNRAMTPTN